MLEIGVLRLRDCFALRSSYFAQDDRASGASYAADSSEASSISFTSLSVSVNSPARITPCAWLAVRAPTIAPVTAGFLRVHAIATSPGERPWRFPISRSRSTSARFCESLGSLKFALVRRQSSFGSGRRVRGSWRRSTGRRPLANKRSRQFLRAGNRARCPLRSHDESSEYGGCNEVTGAMALARRSCFTSKLETPIHRTLPSFFRFSESRPAFFEFARIGIWRPMNLVEINHVHCQGGADCPRLRGGSNRRAEPSATCRFSSQRRPHLVKT